METTLRRGAIGLSLGIALGLAWLPDSAVTRSAQVGRSLGRTTGPAGMQTTTFVATCTECPKNVGDRGTWDFSLNVPEGACEGEILDVDLALNIRHTWRGDITISLKPPTWQTVPQDLISQVGGPGKHLGTGEEDERDVEKFLILDDEAGQSIERGDCADPAKPCYGRWRTPQRTLQRRIYDLPSRRAKGIWTVRVTDGFRLDSADVRDIRLLLKCEGIPTVEPSTTPSETATPTPTETASATPTPSAMATRTHTPTATRTSSPTVTLSPTLTPTRVPVPIYLPLLIHDHGCPPQGIFTDVAIVLDASTTMNDAAGPGMGRKIDIAASAAWQFVDRYLVPGRDDQVGVVLFNMTAAQRQVLTRDRARLVEALAVPREHLRKGSQIHLGIEQAVNMLEDPRFGVNHHRKAMLLISDGLVNPGNPADVLRAADAARRRGITLFAIGYGATVDDSLLQEVADPQTERSTFYYRSPLGADLDNLVGRLSLVVPCPDDIYWSQPGPCAQGETEPNDLPALAMRHPVLCEGRVVAGGIAGGGALDGADYYPLLVDRPTRVQVSMTDIALQGETEVDLGLWACATGGCSQVGWSGQRGSAPELIDVSLAAGTYFVGAHPSGSLGNRVGYRLGWSVVP